MVALRILYVLVLVGICMALVADGGMLIVFVSLAGLLLMEGAGAFRFSDHDRR
jgi:hypothetical protein